MFESIGPSLWIFLAHKTPTYDTKMFLKGTFDKIAGLSNLRLVIILNKTGMTDIENNKKSIGKSNPAYGF